MAGAHILSVDQFERQDIEQLFQTADNMRAFAQKRQITRILEGAILSNMFFEPSTRTRVSFGSAFNLLGGAVRETTDVTDSAIVKGESLRDTARVLSGYSDVIVMRHPKAGAVAHFAQASRVPVINGGDGDHEHPSQALLDLYTIQSERSDQGHPIDNLKIAMMGDLRYGRAVHSLCKILCLFEGITFHLISPKPLRLPENYIQQIEAKGHKILQTEQLQEGLADVDIVYVTRTQEERFAKREEAQRYRGLLQINQRIYTQFCAPNTAIMHPLPRDSRGEVGEISEDLDEHPNLAIFRQADNGVVIRMAIFSHILGVVDLVSQNIRPVRWFRRP